MDTEHRICANCRILVEPAHSGWRHIEQFAEKFTRLVCTAPAPGRTPSASEARFGLGRQRTPGKDKHQLHAQLDLLSAPPGRPLLVATDGAHKVVVTDRVAKPMSWAYLSTDGHYGLGTSIVHGRLIGGHDDRVLQAELRAVANALRALPDNEELRFITDCRDAITFIDLWRTGHDVMPYNYVTDRAGGRESTLGWLARTVREHATRIHIEWVPGHSGHPLNDAVDAMARAARRWSVGQVDAETTATYARRLARAGLDQYARATPVTAPGAPPGTPR